ncbi:MAG: DUF3788 domain-containing protein [Lachnospiraceae bacterium]|nr:DUF3788 domain-containing protein [Lachnospiraceae bacterium]
MATSIFADKAVIPNEDMVNTALADKKPLWDKLQYHISENYQGLDSEWKMYSKKTGWSLVFKQKKRTLFYFVPCESYFIIAFVLGEKAVETAINSPVSEKAKKEIRDADICAMGHSFFIYVKDDKDLEDVFMLIKIKEMS